MHEWPVVVMKLPITCCRNYCLLNHPNSFHRGMKIWCRFIAYLLSHFDRDGHTVHTLTQWWLLTLTSSTAKSSLFMHAHSSPLSLAARLHWCRANCSCYINNGWTFSGQTLSMYVCIYIYIYINISSWYNLFSMKKWIAFLITSDFYKYTNFSYDIYIWYVMVCIAHLWTFTYTCNS